MPHITPFGVPQSVRPDEDFDTADASPLLSCSVNYLTPNLLIGAPIPVHRPAIHSVTWRGTFRVVMPPDRRSQRLRRNKPSLQDLAGPCLRNIRKNCTNVQATLPVEYWVGRIVLSW